MLRIYNIPTHAQYITDAKIYELDKRQAVFIKSSSQIVFYQKSFQLETGKIGYAYKAFIDSEIVDVNRNTYLEIEGVRYDILEFKLSKNLDTYPFYLCELKSQKE